MVPGMLAVQCQGVGCTGVRGLAETEDYTQPLTLTFLEIRVDTDMGYEESRHVYCT